jgi:peptide/nickel transport system ATP-binding protein
MEGGLLVIEDLHTVFHTDAGVVEAVSGLSLSVKPGQTIGLVGESGSGKSVTSLSIMRLLPDAGAEIARGRVSFLGRDLVRLPAREMQALRGAELAMIFQEPMTSLNPVYTVGDQVAEAIRQHRPVSRAEALARTVELFTEVGIPDPATKVHAYPHQMSGGQKQRVMIAMALSCDPKLLIADEPTTALDVTIQAQILELLRQIRDKRGMSMLFITHDLAVIAEIADEVAVMYRGRLVEYGPLAQVYAAPQHPYTRGLLSCRPRPDSPWKRLPTVADFMRVTPRPDGTADIEALEMTEKRLRELTRVDAPPPPAPSDEVVLEVSDLHVHFPVRRGVLGRVHSHVRAVDGVSFSVRKGQTLGLVGESGCGKTTTGRAILRLVEPTSGRVTFLGKDLAHLHGEELRRTRRHIQIIFQDPYSSLNPRLTVEQALTEPMQVHQIGAGTVERLDRAETLLREVGLLPEHLRRYPHEFSGGQRQRICIARALAVGPSFIICDESVSALDVSVQAQVLNLLKDLQEQRGLTYIFISHDLGVVKFMSDEMAVMHAGRIVEMGPAAGIYADPVDPYTQKLIQAIPRDDLDTIARRKREREEAATRRGQNPPA